MSGLQQDRKKRVLFLFLTKRVGFSILLLALFHQLVHKLLKHTHCNSLPEPKHDLEPVGINNNNSWCQLDGNLLGEILSRLCLTDQVRFRVVCKNWLPVSANPFNNNKILLPWYISFDRSLATVRNRFDIKIHDPSSSPDRTSVHSISLTKLGFPSPPSVMNVASFFKSNWLFIGFSKPTFFFWRTKYFLLFSPFTKKLITLPKLHFRRGFFFRLAFSTEPDSPNCVFYLLDAEEANKITLLTYHRRDKEWTAREFNIVPNFVPCCCTPVYFRGILYIVSLFGQLAFFNIVDGVFKFESLSIDQLFLQSCNSRRRHQVFELNGELMILYFGSRKQNNVALSSKQCIRKYDWSNKVWVPVTTLGDKALLVSDKNLGVAIFDRKNGVLPNKIYHFFDGGCHIYSIEGGELVEFKFINLNLSEDGDGDLPEYKYNCGIAFSDKINAGYWLEPPRVRVHPSS